MAVKKHTLEVAEVQERFFDNLALIGIVSPFPAYRFCWLLNASFNLQLTRRPEFDICMQSEDPELEQKIFFPIYQDANELTSTIHTLYRLRMGKEVLLPELPQIDYLWTITCNNPGEVALRYTQLLKEIPEVQLAQMLSPAQLVHAEHLLW